MSEMETVKAGSISHHFAIKNPQGAALAESLIDLGMSPSIVKVLLCLHTHGATTSKILQTRCGLRQPEISTAIKTLNERKMVRIQSKGANGRGRPSHIYELTESLQTCIGQFTMEIEERIADMQKGISTVQKLTQNL
jgi:predicted transcriptional regulator